MMTALTFADLSLSQDLDPIIGGAGYELISTSKENGAWGSYYGGTLISSNYNQQGQLVKQKYRFYRQRTQTETSYWNYYYF